MDIPCSQKVENYRRRLLICSHFSIATRSQSRGELTPTCGVALLTVIVTDVRSYLLCNKGDTLLIHFNFYRTLKKELTKKLLALVLYYYMYSQ